MMEGLLNLLFSTDFYYFCYVFARNPFQIARFLQFLHLKIKNMHYHHHPSNNFLQFFKIAIASLINQTNFNCLNYINHTSHLSLKILIADINFY